MTELASAAAGQFRGEGGRIRGVHGAVDSAAGGTGDWASSVTAGMRGQAQDAADPAAEPAAARGETEKLASGAQGAGQGEATAQEGIPGGDGAVGAAMGTRAAAGPEPATGPEVAAGAGAATATEVARTNGAATPPPDLKERVREAAGPTLELGPEALLPPPGPPSAPPEPPDEPDPDAGHDPGQ
jgi:hypothetical protein